MGCLRVTNRFIREIYTICDVVDLIEPLFCLTLCRHLELRESFQLLGSYFSLDGEGMSEQLVVSLLAKKYICYSESKLVL